MSMKGWPIAGVLEAGRVMKMIRAVRRNLRSKLEDIATALENGGDAVPENINFSFHKVGNKLVIRETSTNKDIDGLRWT